MLLIHCDLHWTTYFLKQSKPLSSRLAVFFTFTLLFWPNLLYFLNNVSTFLKQIYILQSICCQIPFHSFVHTFFLYFDTTNGIVFLPFPISLLFLPCLFRVSSTLCSRFSFFGTYKAVSSISLFAACKTE